MRTDIKSNNTKFQRWHRRLNHYHNTVKDASPNRKTRFYVTGWKFKSRHIPEYLFRSLEAMNKGRSAAGRWVVLAYLSKEKWRFACWDYDQAHQFALLLWNETNATAVELWERFINKGKTEVKQRFLLGSKTKN